MLRKESEKISNLLQPIGKLLVNTWKRPMLENYTQVQQIATFWCCKPQKARQNTFDEFVKSSTATETIALFLFRVL